MERAIKDLEAKRVTRRTVLESAVACAMASIVPAKAFAEIAGATASGGNGDARALNQNRANLYALPGVQPGTAVIAVTWVSFDLLDSSAQKRSQVTVHSGSKKWNAMLPGDSMGPDLLEQDGCRVFAGRVETGYGIHSAVIQAVVIQIPEKILRSLGTMDIWAERVMHTGERKRIGSPFVAALVVEDTALAAMYHRISPSDDRAMLTGEIVTAIAAKASASGLVGNPNAHGRRLASRLLPDVLHYDPQMPSGFTFAAQNGRHPDDLSEVVVNTILSGSPASGVARADVRLQERFPFFTRHGSVA